MSVLGVQALLTSLLGMFAFAYVAHRGARSDLRSPLLWVVGGVVVWMGGNVLIDVARSDELARAGMYVSYLGASVLGPAWLFLAARFTRSALFERRPGLLAAICVPPGLAYLAMLTNDGHLLFGDALTLQALHRPPLFWAGPIFWGELAWQILLVLVGIAMFVRYASRSLGQPRRRHAQAIAGAVAIPVVASLARHFQLLPPDVDPTPIATGLAVATLLTIALRSRLLDFLPLARRDVIDALTDAVFVTDVDGMIIDVNPAARELLGTPARPPRDQPLARTLARLALDPEMESVERDLEAALGSGESVGVPLRTRTLRELEIVVGSVHDREGEPSARYAVARDLTERRRYERLLREGQRRVVVGGIAAGLAHEVNNPLAFVASNLRQIHRVIRFQDGELQALEKPRSDELRELADVVAETIDGVERISEIIGRIMRPGALSKEAVVRLDLERVVRDAIRLVDLHGPHALRTRVECMDALPKIDGCPERLSQALMNLLLNAQTATRATADASLCVDAVADGDSVAVRLCVRRADGSPWSDAPPSFAPEGTTAEAEISAAYETVREHGGTLEAGSEPGMLFVMRLPAAA